MKIISCVVFAFFLLSQPAFPQPEPNFKKIADELEQEQKSQTLYSSEYRKWSLNHTKKIFGFQYISSIIIFFIVLVIVFSGLYFSFIQFKNSLSIKKEIPSSSMKISMSGIEISSSIVGLFTLLISLIFFYLYLEKVYPVSLINFDQELSQESSKSF